MERTHLNFLDKQVAAILEDLNGKPTLITKEAIAKAVCGINYKLANDPFSEEFLANVLYNSNKSFKLVLWLQIHHKQ